MNIKTARRFVNRNKWKAWDGFLKIEMTPSFKRRFFKCQRMVDKADREKLSAPKLLESPRSKVV